MLDAPLLEVEQTINQQEAPQVLNLGVRRAELPVGVAARLRLGEAPWVLSSERLAARGSRRADDGDRRVRNTDFILLERFFMRMLS